MDEGVERPCDGGGETLGLFVREREEGAWGDKGADPLVALAAGEREEESEDTPSLTDGTPLALGSK